MLSVKILVSGQKAQIVECSGRVPIRDLQDVCSFLTPRADYIVQHILEKKRKAGITHPTFDPETLRYRLFSEITLTFPTGLLDDVTQILDMERLTWGIENGQRIVRWNPTFATTDGKQFPELWRHQAEIVQELENHPRGIIKAPTGSGKTVVALWIWGQWQYPFCLVLVPTTLIADQWVEKAKEFFPKFIVGKWYGRHKRTIGAINVMTYSLMQSLIKRGDSLGMKLLTRVRMCIADECHKIGAGKYGRPNITYKSMMFLKNVEIVYGFSATAVMRSDGANIYQRAAIGNVILEIEPETLIKAGLLVQPNIRFIPIEAVGVRWRKKSENPLEYWRYIFETAIINNRERNMKGISEALKMVAQGRQVLMITPEIAHINVIMSLIPTGNPTIESAHRKDKQCDAKIQRFREGKIRLLVCTQQLVGEGVDIPEIAGIVYLGGGRSQTANTQFPGRGMRMTSEKTDCIIIDFADGVDLLAKHAIERAQLWMNLGYKVDLSRVSWMRRILEDKR